MRFRTLLALFLVALAPSGLLGASDYDKASELRNLSIRIGHVVGAASSCEKKSPSRVNAIRNKMTSLLQSQAPSDAEGLTVLQIFYASIAEGMQWIESGRTNCAETERELNQLEAAASNSPQSNAAPAAGPPAQSQQTTQLVTSATSPVAGSVAGEIRLGACLPLTGLIRDNGHSQQVGMEAAVQEANASGGVNGKMLRLLTVDDGYDPERTVKATQGLIDNDRVFAFVGSLGTATNVAALPIALNRHMLFFAPVSGSNALRHEPPDRYVFNYRPSYAEETYAAVRYLLKVQHLKPEQIAVFAQQDGFGDAGFLGVVKAVRALNGGGDERVLRVGYARNTIAVEEAVAQLQRSRPPKKAVVMVAVTRPAARFIEKTRDLFPDLIYTNASPVFASNFRDELMLLGGKYANGVIVTNIVPNAGGYSTIALQFKSALAKYAGSEPANDISFEGYISMKIFIEALRRAGPQADTEKVIETLEGMHGFDLGLGTPINFNKSDHQAIHKVWGLQLTADGTYEPIELD